MAQEKSPLVAVFRAYSDNWLLWFEFLVRILQPINSTMFTKTACLPWLEIPTICLFCDVYQHPNVRNQFSSKYLRWRRQLGFSSPLSHRLCIPSFSTAGLMLCPGLYLVESCEWCCFHSYSKYWHSVNRINEYINENTVYIQNELIIYEIKLFTLCNVFNL